MSDHDPYHDPYKESESWLARVLLGWKGGCSPPRCQRWPPRAERRREVNRCRLPCGTALRGTTGATFRFPSRENVLVLVQTWSILPFQVIAILPLKLFPISSFRVGPKSSEGSKPFGPASRCAPLEPRAQDVDCRQCRKRPERFQGSVGFASLESWVCSACAVYDILAIASPLRASRLDVELMALMGSYFLRV